MQFKLIIENAIVIGNKHNYSPNRNLDVKEVSKYFIYTEKL